VREGGDGMMREFGGYGMTRDAAVGVVGGCLGCGCKSVMCCLFGHCVLGDVFVLYVVSYCTVSATVAQRLCLRRAYCCPLRALTGRSSSGTGA